MGRAAKRRRGKLLAVGNAFEAKNILTNYFFIEKTFDSSGLSAEEALTSTYTVPHGGNLKTVPIFIFNVKS